VGGDGPGLRPDVYAPWLLAGVDAGGLPHRRLCREHHHAPDVVLSAGCCFRAAIRQASWDRDRHGDNVALLSDFFLSLDAALNRLVSVGTAIRPGRGNLLHAGNSIPLNRIGQHFNSSDY